MDERVGGRGAGSAGEVFLAFLGQGLTAFGGPVAHLGCFRQEFVVRRRWLDEAAFADLVALCQFLPGPASSQVGMGLGLLRAGRLGAVAAFAGFTTPSAVAMILFGLGFSVFGGGADGALHGLKVAAAAVVAGALLGMVRSLAATPTTASIAVAGLGFAVLVPGVVGQSAALAAGAAAGLASAALTPTAGPLAPVIDGEGLETGVGRIEAAVLLAVFAAISIGLPLAAAGADGTIALVDAFWRAGSRVFGGGHVVLPLLQAEMVTTGRVGADAFLAGYGAAQAVPGPLFTFAGFLGAVAGIGPGGWLGGVTALASIFAPSGLLVVGALPFWQRLRRRARVRAAMVGVDAAVVGLLAAAFFDPVWSRAILAPKDLVVVAAAFVALVVRRAPPWAVVAACAAIGAVTG